MKRNIFLLVLSFVSVLIYSQNSFFVKSCDFKGSVFKKEHFVFMSIENQKDRYTPTKEDIIYAEKLIKDSIDIFLKNEYPYKTAINGKTIRGYKRQYIGFIDKDNNKVIWINFLRNKTIKDKELSYDVITVLDGAEDYWNIYVNISKNKLFKISINGIS